MTLFIQLEAVKDLLEESQDDAKECKKILLDNCAIIPSELWAVALMRYWISPKELATYITDMCERLDIIVHFNKYAAKRTKLVANAFDVGM